MNAYKFAFAFALAAASAMTIAAPADKTENRTTVNAYANDFGVGEGYMADTHFVSTKTREEVKAELREAIRRGEIYYGDDYPGPMNAPSTKTRAQVIAELKEYRIKHPVDIYEGATMP